MNYFNNKKFSSSHSLLLLLLFVAVDCDNLLNFKRWILKLWKLLLWKFNMTDDAVLLVLHLQKCLLTFFIFILVSYEMMIHDCIDIFMSSSFAYLIILRNLEEMNLEYLLTVIKHLNILSNKNWLASRS